MNAFNGTDYDILYPQTIKGNITDFAHKSTHAIGGSDALTAADIGAVVEYNGEITLPAAASWTSNATTGQYAYYIDLAIAQLTATNDIWIDRAYTTDKTADETYKTAFGCVTAWVQSAGILRAYAETPPVSACPLNWTVME